MRLNVQFFQFILFFCRRRRCRRLVHFLTKPINKLTPNFRFRHLTTFEIE